jgi:hypothetical protein
MSCSQVQPLPPLRLHPEEAALGRVQECSRVQAFRRADEERLLPDRAAGGARSTGAIQGDQVGATEGVGDGEHQQRPIAQPATMRRSSSIEIPTLLAWAVPIVRRMPAKVAFTVSSWRGRLTPASW